MTSFGWKKKTLLAGKQEKLEPVFHEKEQLEEEEVDPDFDWVAEAKKRKVIALEDNSIRFKRLKQEGSALAEESRFWEAINRWDEALLVNSQDAKLLEMKAQALIQLHEWTPAIEFAEQAIKAQNTWWVGYQTLGRAHLGLGEVQLALRNFQIAAHLNPDESEIWTEDIAWARHLITEGEKRQLLLSTAGEEEVLELERIKPDSLNLQDSVNIVSQQSET